MRDTDIDNEVGEFTVDNVDENDYDGDGNPGTEGGAIDQLLTVQEICDLRKVKKTYVYWLTRQRKIPHIKIQGILRFRKSAIDRWLESQEVRATQSVLC